MSVLDKLTEGIVNRDLSQEGAALLNKWEKTGLLEGLDNDRTRNSMARLLENQAKELLRETSAMAAGDVEGFAAVAFPIVRRVFGGLIANDLVSVQPMSLPSGLIFFLDFVFSGDIGAAGSEASRSGNYKDKSIYGTNRVGSEITGGVDLVGSLKEDLSGPRTVGARGYNYGSPTGSSEVTSSTIHLESFSLTGATAAQKKSILHDPDLISLSSSATARWIIRADIPRSGLSTQTDFNNYGALSSSISGGAASGHPSTDLATLTGLSTITSANTQQLRRLTCLLYTSPSPRD